MFVTSYSKTLKGTCRKGEEMDIMSILNRITFHIICIDVVRKIDNVVAFRIPVFFYISPKGKDLIQIENTTQINRVVD